ncbi:uncharacterized protein [Physeter macrocephalus]|uniref:Beta-retroviral matrix protein domain-containing protein n=1 Tax=Physeter macrocephalus TaxID=9755 RepID=A0A9W2WPX5_PHYMC|nr:uncharacterized protein LOC114486455 [Physeter catodon]XP_054941374.1 uncharacterized protein LOC114486455 [Physeter catodon]
MGQKGSKERQLFAQVLLSMLKARGTTVTASQVSDFLQHVYEVSPWFPEGGSVDAAIWKRVGEDLKRHYDKNGPGGVPVITFSNLCDISPPVPSAPPLMAKMALETSSDEDVSFDLADAEAKYEAEKYPDEHILAQGIGQSHSPQQSAQLLHWQDSEDKERFAFSLPALNFREPMMRYQWKMLPQGMANLTRRMWRLRLSRPVSVPRAPRTPRRMRRNRRQRRCLIQEAGNEQIAWFHLQCLVFQARRLMEEGPTPRTPLTLFLAMIAVLGAPPVEGLSYWAYIPDPPLLQPVTWAEADFPVFYNDSTFGGVMGNLPILFVC